ncbi:cytochrome P450 [Streptomyces sp. MUM 203J]|uniref:cytochrome P450 n=1 Tax=Streptomyces sp. MUM 203J TaxID=2791990 RepID=UPI001F03EA08|nr:cytochrome P450 [Streptomyces sp. MUM 203J]MCH0543090.1 cytochrome P450 [Streptomyces sp. MUM 203J]
MNPAPRSARTDLGAAAPVAPGALPVIGHALQLWRRPMAFLESLRPVGDVVRVRLGNWPLHVLTSPELVHTVLVGEAQQFGRGRIFEKMRPLFGNAIATADGAFHRRQRRIIQPGFHRSQIAGHAQRMGRNAEEMAASWSAGRLVAVDEEMRRFALSSVADMIFSGDVGRRAVEEVHRSCPVIMEGMLVRTLMPKALDRLPIPLNRRFDAAAARLRAIIDEVIEEYGEGDRERQDLLSLLMTGRDPETGEGMSAVQLRDELITILFGGTETAATTLSWVFHELARHPEVEKRLHAEVDAVVGDRCVRVEDLPRLTYTTHVLNETLRLHSALVFTRKVLSPVTLGGVRVAAGSELAYSPYALHRDPGSFRDPGRFDPDRWSHTDAGRLHRLSGFIPFGAGQHKCIGDSFAMVEMLVVVASVAARWRLVPAPGTTVRELPAGIPMPDALPMIPQPRR